MSSVYNFCVGIFNSGIFVKQKNNDSENNKV